MINLHPYANTKEDNKKLIDSIINYLNSNLKLVISCSSLTTCDLIVKNIEQFFGSNKNIKYYHGKDEKIDDNGEYHSSNKRKDFTDNNCWINCDVLIYTSTLTAGVDFNYVHFDKLIGVYS